MSTNPNPEPFCEPVTVETCAEVGTPPTLPATGASGAISGLGVALVVIGGVLVRAAGRRRCAYASTNRRCAIEARRYPVT